MLPRRFKANITWMLAENFRKACTSIIDGGRWHATPSLTFCGLPFWQYAAQAVRRLGGPRASDAHHRRRADLLASGLRCFWDTSPRIKATLSMLCAHSLRSLFRSISRAQHWSRASATVTVAKGTTRTLSSRPHSSKRSSSKPIFSLWWAVPFRLIATFYF